MLGKNITKYLKEATKISAITAAATLNLSQSLTLISMQLSLMN